jgi:hypothetical protein
MAVMANVSTNVITLEVGSRVDIPIKSKAQNRFSQQNKAWVNYSLKLFL